MRFSYRLVLICACLLPITPSFFPTFACVQCSILTGELNALVRLINTIMGGTPYKDHREVLARLRLYCAHWCPPARSCPDTKGSR